MALELTHAQDIAEQATAHLIQKYSLGGNRVGWMMIASIFIEAWDLYSISFLLGFCLCNTIHRPCCSGWLRRAHRPARLSVRCAAAG